MIRSWKAAVLGLALAVLTGAALLASQSLDAGAAAPAGPTEVARGQYLVTLMDCAGCHTPGALQGQLDPDRRLAGSNVGFATAAGIVYPPNLTPDMETGLGRWSDAEILRAIRHGQARDGRVLVPVMPWPSYRVLTEADARAIVAHLRSLPPVRFASPRNTDPGEPAAAPYLTVVAPR